MPNIMVEIAERAFREMGETWFNYHMKLRAHKRDSFGENEETEKCRVRDNHVMKSRYDAQTEGILCGEDYLLTPTCANDLNKRRR